MELEDIGSWTGQDVVGVDDERIGKLSEVYTEVGGTDPAIGAVKVGRLAGRLHLVPLTDAVFSRGHVRVPLSKDQVSSAPEIDASGQLSRAEEVAYAQHYGLDEPDVSGDPNALRYESATARSARRDAMDADRRRAEEMEAEAARLGESAEEADARATEAAHQARADRDRQQHLVTEAASIRHALDAAPPA